MLEQVKLPYVYDALEPYVDTLTMETHYSKHHATYTNALNAAAEKAGVTGQPIEQGLSSLDGIDESLRGAIRNNGGGFYHHNLYFSVMSPTPAAEPTGVLREKAEKTFGRVGELKAQFKNAAVGRFGSGWAWLNAAADGTLSVTSGSTRTTPLARALVSPRS